MKDSPFPPVYWEETELKTFKNISTKNPFRVFLLLERTALTAHWGPGMDIQDFLPSAPYLTQDYQLQDANSWSPSGDASWMGKEELAEWIITHSCSWEHPAREQFSKLPGVSKDPQGKWALQFSYRIYPHSGLGPRVILRIRKQVRDLQQKKMGHIF